MSLGSIAFRIPGQPVAKGRPRFARGPKFVRTYTPLKTVIYENLVKDAAAQMMGERPPFEAPLSLTVEIGLQIPISWSKKKQAKAANGEVAATKKPDADNILKSIKDGVNGVVWRDDSQVVSIALTKRYAVMPGVSIVVNEMPQECA